MKKNWIIAQSISEDFKNQFPEVNSVILQLLYNRGAITQRQIDEFLFPDYSRDMRDPFLFTDMAKAIERINRAIEQKENILIYSDYDADGITSAAVLKNALEKLGAKNLSLYLPDREKEGYGLREVPIREAAANKVSLIITCDQGITNPKEVDLANELGMDVVLTDHHLPLETLPKAYAILDPHADVNYPCKYLAGVGVAFKLVQALFNCRMKHDSSFKGEAYEKWMLDLVAIGTVSDMMKILDENRTMVKYGLIVLNKTNRLGLRTLFKESNLTPGTIDTRTIYFQIGPRLNVASRMDHANTALELILTEDEQEAARISADLNRINQERQKLVDNIFQGLKKSFGPEPKEKILIGYGDAWPVGVLGLIAGKVRDEYQRPALAITKQGDILTGRGRSNDQLNLVELFSALGGLLSRFGGHRKAAGFALNESKLEEFKKLAYKIVKEKMQSAVLIDDLMIEAEIELGQVSWELQENLEQFAPFGEGNPNPLFLVKDLKVENIQWVGQNNKHLKLVANGRKFIHFCADGHCKEMKLGDEIDAVIEIGVNQWNGTKELQLKIVDLKIK
ncbi:MAG: single-stranded-DNA-specific exonuclease RecJ [Patescibacteria group bacterium]|nr:single-stranded-DNA-specific exonuclease RecJ [Patescibacteria group bacterium]MDD5121754.1 single-stranded-DNA-specific exonuclease RecJ [Patescibacteria group bacterium]